MNLLVVSMCLWFVFQMFNYEYLNIDLSWAFLNPQRFLFVFSLLLFIILTMRRKIKWLPKRNIEVFLLVFTLICTASLFIHLKTIEDAKASRIVYLINMTFYPLITYFIAKNIPLNRTRVKIFLITFTLFGVYLSLTALGEHFKLKFLVWPKYILDPELGIQLGRVRGPFLQTSSMGAILIVGLLSTWFLAQETSKSTRALLYFLTVLMTGSIYLTYTRSIWLGFGSALLIASFFKSRLRKPAMILCLICFIAFLTGIGNKLSFIENESLFSKRESTMHGRIANWITAWKMFTHNPLFGIGFGKYNQEFFNYYTEIEGIPLKAFDGNHNTFLGILAEVGVFGFGCFTAIYLGVTRQCIKTYRQFDTSQVFEKKIIVMTLALLSMHLLTCIFIDARYHPLKNSCMFFLLGITARLGLLADRLTSQESRSVQPKEILIQNREKSIKNPFHQRHPWRRTQSPLLRRLQ